MWEVSPRENISEEAQTAQQEMREFLSRAEERFSWPPGKKEMYFYKFRKQWLTSVLVLSSLEENDWRVLKWPIDVFFELSELWTEMHETQKAEQEALRQQEEMAESLNSEQNAFRQQEEMAESL